QCTTDSQCDAGVCRTAAQAPACASGTGPSFCLPACAADDQCPPADQCTAGHCVPRTCSTCPSYLNCVGGSASGTCQAKSCGSDADCPKGYCVKGSCEGSLGICTLGCG
ncbi:MAG: hypothetical protein ACRENE_24950, partial [Polyangiaceae bacterium]